MAVFSPLAHDIYCIDACYVSEQVASIYLLKQADEFALIETGTSHSIDNVLKTLAQLGISNSQIKYVIPTHVHLDHAGGASEMMKHFTQASLIIHPRGARHMINPEKLIAGSMQVYGEEKFNQLYGDIQPIAEDRIIIANDLDCFELDSRQLLFFDSPGHARHHFCILDETSEGIFTGDTFGLSYRPMKDLARGLIPSTPPVQFDPQALHLSIDRIMSYKPNKLYLTHYGEYFNPQRQTSSFHQWIDTYVETCNRIMPVADNAEQALQQSLRKLILTEMADARDPQQIDRVLAIDIELNAQGLAYWWKALQSD